MLGHHSPRTSAGWGWQYRCWRRRLLDMPGERLQPPSGSHPRKSTRSNTRRLVLPDALLARKKLLGISVLPLLVAQVVDVRNELLKASAWNRRRWTGEVLAPSSQGLGVVNAFACAGEVAIVQAGRNGGRDAAQKGCVVLGWGFGAVGLLQVN